MLKDLSVDRAPAVSRRRGRESHVSITGHLEEMREDTDLADIDRLAQEYMAKPARSATAAGSAPGSPWTAGCGALRQARPNDSLPVLTSQNRMFCARRKDHQMRSRTALNPRSAQTQCTHGQLSQSHSVIVATKRRLAAGAL